MANIEKMLEEIEKMTVIELADLVKAIEEKFGVSAAAVAAPAAAGEAAGAAEKSEFDVILVSAGGAKLAVIKEVLSKAGLTVASGIDSGVFFHNDPPEYELIKEYRDPLIRLKDK